MKLRLALLNIALPFITLFSLGFLPDTGFLLPDYISIFLIAFIIGRAFLLLQQQTVFGVLPILLLAIPEPWALGFDPQAPFAIICFLLYQWVVNLQWGYRPWFHPLHIFNLVLLGLFLGFASRYIAVPISWLPYEKFSILWPSIFFAITPLFFVSHWSRIGRWSSYWPLMMMVALSFNWADQNLLFLWVSVASLFSLTLDSYVMSFVDELTGIPGRRSMEIKLKMQRKHYFISMVDVDHFKNFNDKHGHLVGDDVLKVIAKLISKTPRANAYRYGGEEFCLIFANCSQAEVLEALDKTRLSIADYELYPKNKNRIKSDRGRKTKTKVKPLHITASFGLAQQEGSQRFYQVIERADKALYKAKQAGRNCVRVAK